MNVVWNIPKKSTKGYWERAFRNFYTEEEGQGVVEYVLLVGIILSAVLVIAKPFFKRLQEALNESFKDGIFGETTNFYYFPIKKRE